MKDVDLYKKFKEIYKKNWKIIHKEDKDRNKTWELIKRCSGIVVLILLVFMFWAIRKDDILFQFVFMIGILIYVTVVSKIDEVIYKQQYILSEEQRMSCVESTIKDIMPSNKGDVQGIMLFVDEMEKNTRNRLGYKVSVLISKFLSEMLLFVIFIILMYYQPELTDKSFVSIVLVFFLQEFFGSNFFKNLFIIDYYYNSLLKRYKTRIIYGSLKKRGLGDSD